MSSDIPKSSYVSVGNSLCYRAKDDGTLLLDFDSWVQQHDRGHAQKLCRIDILVETEHGNGDLWLVETKDFRLVGSPQGHRPNQSNTDRIEFTLKNKLEQTIEYIESYPSCPAGIRQMLQPVSKRVFVYHCEMPRDKSAVSAYFPLGYPLNQFSQLRSTLKPGLVRVALCVDAERCNSNNSIPWRVELREP